jgi:hypothetical protein
MLNWIYGRRGGGVTAVGATVVVESGAGWAARCDGEGITVLHIDGLLLTVLKGDSLPVVTEELGESRYHQRCTMGRWGGSDVASATSDMQGQKGGGETG